MKKKKNALEKNIKAARFLKQKYLSDKLHVIYKIIYM